MAVGDIATRIGRVHKLMCGGEKSIFILAHLSGLDEWLQHRWPWVVGKGGEHHNCVYIAQKDLEGRNNSRESLRAAPNSSLAETVLHLLPSLQGLCSFSTFQSRVRSSAAQNS